MRPIKTTFLPKAEFKKNHLTGTIRENIWLIVISIFLFYSNQFVEYSTINVFNLNPTFACGWDCGWYSGLVANGYDIEPHAHPKMDAANWAFFPLFPMISKFVAFIYSIPAPEALIISSKFFLLLSIFSFMKMAKAYFPKTPTLITGSVVAFSPYAIYGNVGYTESSFLFFSCVFFLLLKKQKFILAGLSGALLSSARFVGFFSFFSYVIFALITFFRKKQNCANDIEYIILGALLVPLGLAIFMLYLYFLTGDALAFSHIQIAWNRIPENPFVHIINGLHGNSFSKYLSLLSLTAIFTSFFFIYKGMPELATFALFCTLVPLSTGLAAMPRYIFWQAPILLFISYLCSRRMLWLFLIPFFMASQIYLYLAWFSGKGWVI